MSFPREEHSPLLAKIGELVSKWNVLEGQVRYTLMFVLERVCPPSPAAQILTAHMGSVALTEALRTAANEFTSDNIRKRLLHSADYIDRLRAYRNFYVHGFTHVGWNRSREPIGFLQSTSAKSRLIEHEDTFLESDVEDLISKIAEIQSFIGQLYSFLRDGEQPRWTSTHGPWREMPPLPPLLKKPRRFALDVGQPRQAQPKR